MLNVSLEQQKHTKKTEYLYAQVHTIGAGSIIAACLLVVIYWTQLNTSVLVGWLLAVLTVISHRFYTAAAFRRRDRYSSGSDRWYKIYADSVLVNGCLWGAMGVYVAHQASAEQLPYMLMILGALVACASISKNSFFDIYTRFAIPALVAPGLYLLTQFSSDKFMIGILVLCWFALMYSTAWRFNKFVSSSLGFEFENIALLGELEASKARIAKLQKNTNLQEKVIENLEKSIGSQRSRYAPAAGTRLTTAQEKTALRFANK